MDIGTKYSSKGSYADPVDIKSEAVTVEIQPRSFCDGFEDYSKSSAIATSWATAVITAAESAYRKQTGNDIKFSLKHLLTCLPRSCDMEPNNVTNFDIIRFVTEEGLISEESELLLEGNDICGKNVPERYHFQVTQIDVPNMSGLKNLVAEENPVIVLLALDLLRLRVTNNVVGDYIYTGAAYDPSLYGVVLGYDEEKWKVTFNVVPCENIMLQLPVVDNKTNANYAGIAGYAFSMSFTEVTTPEPPGDPNIVHVTLSVSYGTTPTNSGTVKLYDALGRTEVFSMTLSGENDEREEVDLNTNLMKIVVEGGPWSEGSVLKITSRSGTDSIDLSSIPSDDIYFYPESGVVKAEEISEVSDCVKFNEALASSKIVHLKSGVCTDVNDKFSIKNTDKVILLWIEEGNFPNMNAFTIDGAEYLEYLIFGDTALSYGQGGSGRRLEDVAKSFRVANSPKLSWIQLGDGMFADYTSFTLLNLPSLQFLQVGSENFINTPRFSISGRIMF